MLINARVATVGALPALPQEPLVAAGPATPARGTRRIYLGEWLNVPVYDFEPGIAMDLDAAPTLLRAAARRRWR